MMLIRFRGDYAAAAKAMGLHEKADSEALRALWREMKPKPPKPGQKDAVRVKGLSVSPGFFGFPEGYEHSAMGTFKGGFVASTEPVDPPKVIPLPVGGKPVSKSKTKKKPGHATKAAPVPV